jgi:hypothetical protein
MPDAIEPAPGGVGAGGALEAGGGRSIGIISTTGGGGMGAGGGAGGALDSALDSVALAGVFFPDFAGEGFFLAFSGAGIVAACPLGGGGCWASASC